MNAQRGFTLLEGLISLAIVSIVVLGVAGAVLGSLHATNRTLARQALADDALNILSDIRTATAYDAKRLAALVGQSTTATVVRDGRNIAVVLAVTQARSNAPIVAHVTLTDPDGVETSEQQQLYFEAPEPGSIVDQGSPLPGTPAPAPTPSYGSGYGGGGTGVGSGGGGRHGN